MSRNTALTLVPSPRDFVLGQLIRGIRKEVRRQFRASDTIDVTIGRGESTRTISRAATVEAVTDQVLLDRFGNGDGEVGESVQLVMAAFAIPGQLDRDAVESAARYTFPWLTGRACDKLLGDALALVKVAVMRDVLSDPETFRQDSLRRRRRRRVRRATG